METTRGHLLKLLNIPISQIKMSENIAMFSVALQNKGISCGWEH